MAKTALQNDILTALRESTEPMTNTAIASEIGKAKSTVSTALKVMARDGLVKRDAKTKKYSVVAQGYAAPGEPFEQEEAA